MKSGWSLCPALFYTKTEHCLLVIFPFFSKTCNRIQEEKYASGWLSLLSILSFLPHSTNWLLIWVNLHKFLKGKIIFWTKCFSIFVYHKFSTFPTFNFVPLLSLINHHLNFLYWKGKLNLNKNNLSFSFMILWVRKQEIAMKQTHDILE
jgi:hypothetical protein